MARNPKLTPSSYFVLGLVDAAGEATPYQLKQLATGGPGSVWSLQHAQIYKETERLAKAGLLDEEREAEGRRRKRYRLTKPGREALAAWVRTPTAAGYEIRDQALLKLAFGADPATLAPAQIERHAAKLREYTELREAVADKAGRAAAGPLMALEAGIGHEREYLRFWKRAAG